MGKKKLSGKKKTFESVIDDLSTRFILNLPTDGGLDTARLFFQLEQAHWYYEDFVADHNPHLPHYHSLKYFCEMMFKRCFPDMESQFRKLYSEFTKYKDRIPTFGAILMNEKMTKVVLVESWKGKVWGFPRGKINQCESDSTGAIREVQEEVGFDITSLLNVSDFLELTSKQSSGKVTKLFIIRNVPEKCNFVPEVRKEIRSVMWFPIKGLLSEKWREKHTGTGSFKTTIPFVRQLKRWIRTNKKSSSKKHVRGRSSSEPRPQIAAPVQRSQSAPRIRRSQMDSNNADTFGLGNATQGARDVGWSPNDMFATNERIIGKKFVYDGNPQTFGIAQGHKTPILPTGTNLIFKETIIGTEFKPTTNPQAPGKKSGTNTKTKEMSIGSIRKSSNQVEIGQVEQFQSKLLGDMFSFSFNKGAIMASLKLRCKVK